jgi:hypothetical protein
MTCKPSGDMGPVDTRLAEAKARDHRLHNRLASHSGERSLVVQSWSSLDGESTVLARFQYRSITVKSLFFGETTVRKGSQEVPMDHLPRLNIAE